MPWIGSQELDGFINGFFFAWDKSGIAFKKDDLKKTFKGKGFRGHISLFFEQLECFRSCICGDTASGVSVYFHFLSHPIGGQFFGR